MSTTMFAALDLASGELFYRFRDRFPTGTLYLVCDNYGSHGKAEVTAWYARNDIEWVFTPSNGSGPIAATSTDGDQLDRAPGARCRMPGWEGPDDVEYA